MRYKSHLERDINFDKSNTNEEEEEKDSDGGGEKNVQKHSQIVLHFLSFTRDLVMSLRDEKNCFRSN